jgi:Uma2 family endonuclease
MSIAAKAPSPRRMLDGVPPDTRVVIAGVTWEFYDRFSRAVREGDNCRVAFDGIDIEMMTLGPLHERYKTRLDMFVAIVADELAIEFQPQGSTTWKRKRVKRGVEPDSCFYFKAEKLLACAAAEEKGSNKVEDYPNPDLAIEVDLSPSKIDRPGIYAALQVGELWRIRDKVVSIEQLVSPGAYVAAARSQFLPVRPEDVTRRVFGEYSRDPITWKQRLREWVRTGLV